MQECLVQVSDSGSFTWRKPHDTLAGALPSFLNKVAPAQRLYAARGSMSMTLDPNMAAWDKQTFGGELWALI